MNRNQKHILLGGVAVFILMSLYPPWQFVSHRPLVGEIIHPAGYGLIFSPPKPELHTVSGIYGGTNDYTAWGDYKNDVEARINTTTLGIEWITLAVSVSVLMVLAKSVKT